MKHRITIMFLIYFIGLFLVAWSVSAKAQESQNSALYKTILALDSRLFNDGFNRCQLEVFEQLPSNDFEFFHDQGGIQNRAEFLQAVKQNICSNRHGKPIRTLVAGSVSVYPLQKDGVLYGAIEQGRHIFTTKGSKLSDSGYTVANFTHVWLLQNGQWKLSRVISFDHQHLMPKSTTALAANSKLAPKPFTIYELGLFSHRLRLDYL